MTIRDRPCLSFILDILASILAILSSSASSSITDASARLSTCSSTSEWFVWIALLTVSIALTVVLVIGSLLFGRLSNFRCRRTR